MAHIDRFEVLARFRYFCDHPMGIRQGPLGIDENGVLLSHDDDGSNFKAFLVAEEDLGG